MQIKLDRGQFLGVKNIFFAPWDRRILHMKNTMIRLSSPEAVQEFVNAAGRCSFDIDAKHNRIIVDAKSFLGVLGLSSNPISVYSHGEDLAFEKTLEKFAIC